VLAVFAVLYAGLLRPVFAARSTAVADIARQQALLNDVETVAQRFGPQAPGGAAPMPGTGESLVVLIDRSTRERALGPYLKRNQPEGPDGVRLRLENAPFDAVAEWLVETEQRYGLGTVSAAFDPTGEPGRVNANLVLARGGAPLPSIPR
jgi:type II secretory pathway component PulM